MSESMQIRPIPGLPGAWAGEDGTIFRPYRGYTSPGADYRKVTVNGRTLSVHRAVCTAFHGDAPSSTHQAAHLNGDPSDNRAANLRWVTPKENAAHCIEHGTRLRGEAHYSSKVTERDVKVIRRAWRMGFSQKDLMLRFGISRSTVSNITSGRTWAHVNV